MEANKKAFTLVELLVSMAIIAILLGLAVFGITIVQQNARDTQRRSKVNDIEIALNGLIASNQSLPSNFTGGSNTTSSIVAGSTTVQLPGHLERQETDASNAAETSVSVSDYCYGVNSSLYVVGVELEGGGFYFKTNSGATYNTAGSGGNFVAAPTAGSGPDCTDSNL